MKASVSPRYWGSSVAATARSYDARSGPCALIELCTLAPPGTKPPCFASYSPFTNPMNSLITLRWKYGGREGGSAAPPPGGERTQATLAGAGGSPGRGGTGERDGAGWVQEERP